MYEGDIGTDGGAFVAGDANLEGGDFTGRDSTQTGDKIESKSEVARTVATGKDIEQTEITQRFASNVTIYAAPQASRDERLREGLMPSVEQELRSEIKELTRAVIRLESSVDKNNTITTQQVEAIKAQSLALETKFEQRLAGTNLVTPQNPFPRWIGYVALAILTFIAVLLMWVVLYMTRGGA